MKLVGKALLVGVALIVAICLGDGRSRPVEAQHGFTFDLPLSQLASRQDAILTDLTGTVGPGMLGHTHGLTDDEDLHFALAAPAMETAVVCELMNALSVLPPRPGSTSWRARFQPLFANRATLTVRGVFRVWPDHPTASSSATGHSNPPHVVEVHPIAAVSSGNISFDTRASIRPITLQGREFHYKDARQWSAMLRRQIEAHVVTLQGRQFLRLQTPEVGFNYWKLRVTVMDPVTAVPDGHRFAVRVLTPTRAFLQNVRCFTVASTAADAAVVGLTANQEVTVVAIGRLDLSQLLRPGGFQGPVPVELCVFGINPLDLPDAR